MKKRMGIYIVTITLFVMALHGTVFHSLKLETFSDSKEVIGTNDFKLIQHKIGNQNTRADPWTLTGGGDHEGEDWIPEDGSEIAGMHWNISEFRIEMGYTVSIKAWNGTTYGTLIINATRIVINGKLNGNARGYKGGDLGLGYTIQCKDGEGPGFGKNGTNAGGASFGGKGGGNNGGCYGNFYDFSQLYMGSGGAGSRYSAAGRGFSGGNGGAGVLFYTESIFINDTISVNGGAGSASGDGRLPSGGGSGGEVIIFSSEVYLYGKIFSNGGNGGYTGTTYGFGGGGGRIIIYYYRGMISSYYIKMSGGYHNGEEGTIFINAIPVEPMLHSPTNNSFFNKSELQLEWEESRDDGELQYFIQIDEYGSDWSSPCLEKSVTTNYISIDFSTLPSQKYQWRVKVYDGFYNSSWSDIHYFSIDTEIPSTPSVISGITYDMDIITWNWLDGTDATSGIKGYNISVVIEGVSGNQLISEDFVVKPIYQLKGAIHGNSYSIKIRSVDNAENYGEWSNSSEPIIIDSKAPICYIPVPNYLYCNNGTLSWSWAPADESASGIFRYIFSVGTLPGDDNIISNYSTMNCSVTIDSINIEKNYYAKIRAEDKAGNLGDWVIDTKGITLDHTSPQVLTRSPKNGEESVSPNMWIVFQFSETISNDTLTEDDITFEDMTGKKVSYEISYLGSAIILKPNIKLSEYTEYIVILSSSISDLANNPLSENCSTTFLTVGTVEIPENVFYVKEINPSNNSKNLSIDASFTIKFSSPLNYSSLNGSITLSDSSNNIPSSIEYNNIELTATLIPDASLDYGKTYSLILLKSIKNITGINLDEKHTFTFSIMNDPSDKTIVISKNPQGNNAPLNTIIIVSFNRFMDTLSVENAFSIVPDRSGSFSWDNRTLIFTPDGNFNANTKYEITIDKDAMDTDGNKLNETYSWNFATSTSDVIPSDDDTKDDDKTLSDESKGISPWVFVSIVLSMVVLVLIALMVWRRKEKEPKPPITKIKHIEPTQPISRYSPQSNVIKQPAAVITSIPTPQVEMPYQQPSLDRIPAPQSQYPPEEKIGGIFKPDRAISCKICFGNIKPESPAFRCKCGNAYHPVCIVRINHCPVCNYRVRAEDVGIYKDKIRIHDVSSTEDAAQRVHWIVEPKILGHTDDFQINDAFLIYSDGRLIKSVSFKSKLSEGMDEDIMSGMLTAVTDFIKDSFSEKSGTLKTLQYGKMTIFIERGATMFLAVVFEGQPPEDLRMRMRLGIIRVWEKYKTYLKMWDGSYDGLDDIDVSLVDFLGVENAKRQQDDDYQPPKYTGDILTEELGGELPHVVTTADLSTPQGCYHLYNMLLAKKGSDIRTGLESPKTDIGKARKQIIMMYHPDRWQTDKEKATFFMQKVNVAWEVLSSIDRD